MNWEKIISNRFYEHSKIHGKYLSLLSMLGMGVGCFAIIIAISVMNGFENIVHTKLKGFEGDIRIFDNTNNGSWQKLDGIKTIMPFMERKAVLESTDNMKVVSIKAIDEKRMASFYDFSLRGSLPSSGEVLIGQDLAYRLGKKVGGFILIYSPIDQIIGLSAPFKKRFLISGIFSTKILNYDEKSLDLFYWYQQLVAESLGKKSKGILPIVSKMPQDNHSLMQFYLDGTKNNFYTFFFTKEIFSQKIKNEGLLSSRNYLKNKNLQHVLYDQFLATQKVFKKKNIPFRSFIIEKRDESTLGTLFSYFILETILLGKALKINPYDQPSVELIKKETKKRLIKS